MLTIEFMLRMWISLTNSYRNLLSECVNGKVNIVDPDQTECAVVSVSRNEPSTEKIRKISGKFMTSISSIKTVNIILMIVLLQQIIQYFQEKLLYC